MKHANVEDKPIKALLGNINSSLIRRLLELRYAGDETKIPTVDYLSANPPSMQEDILASFDVERTDGNADVTYELGTRLPSISAWLKVLAGPTLSWLRALLISPTIIQGSSYIDNPMRRLLAPRTGQRVVVGINGSNVSSIMLLWCCLFLQQAQA